MTDEKRGKLLHMSGAVALALAAIETGEPLKLTETEWAAHDAAIRASVERDRERTEADRRRALAVALGDATSAVRFPARALAAAHAADESKSAIARIRDWNPGERSVLVLSGATGCGKTVAAAWWALRRTEVTAFLRATTFAASSRYDREARASWSAASALVLDDLGTEYLDTKGSFLVDLDELIDVSYGDRRPLVITTNCTMPLFRERYGARVVDRVRECGVWFAVGGTSMRAAPVPS